MKIFDRRRSFPLRIIGCSALAMLVGGASAPQIDDSPPRLEMPIECVVGKNCFIQQYMDHATGSDARDYQCGPESYDAHEGTDFRLSSMAEQRARVRVLAAAPGTVLAIRNTEPDRLMGEKDTDAVKGRECGNGVLIDHGGRWQTQYCHMAGGSIAVKVGDTVTAGQALGLVGLSGQTQFPHLHLTVRHGLDMVDPFAPSLKPGQCGEGGGTSLWTDAARRLLKYRPAAIIDAGFTDGPVSEAELDAGTLHSLTLSGNAVVLYVRAINLAFGDQLTLTVRDPAGTTLVDHQSAMDGNKAQWLSFAGRARPTAGWKSGRYVGRITVARKGSVVDEREISVDLSAGAPGR